MGAQTAHTVTVMLTDLDRQMSMPGRYWHANLGGVLIQIKKGIDNNLNITACNEHGDADFQVLNRAGDIRQRSRHGSVTVKRSDLSHQNGGGIIIELLPGTQ